MLYNYRNMNFLSSVCLPDSSQKVLTEYCQTTEEMLQNVLQEMDSTAKCRIIPSADLGFPNNVLRLAGGFATGLCIDWQCSRPFVPVDTTVNVCSSSICRLNVRNTDEIKSFFTSKRIQDVTEEMRKKNFLFNFASGNHFAMISVNKRREYFLVLHSSDNFYKDKVNGLYPNNQSWFKDQIHIYTDKTNHRILRYLRDEAAQRFIRTARDNEDKNRIIHKEFSKALCGDYLDENAPVTHHHYGMPTDHTIAIGTCLLDETDTVPIFSTRGYPICLFQPNRQTEKVTIDSREKFLVPHGWGQEIKGVRGIRLDLENKNLIIATDKSDIINPINSQSRISPEYICVRDLRLNNTNYFSKEFEEKYLESWNGFLKGNLRDILYPVALYSRDCKEIEYYDETGR